MTKAMRVDAAVLTATVLVCLGCKTEAVVAPPAAGTQAPAFTLPSQTEALVSLSDFKGKWVVLFFYPANFSEAGVRQVKALQEDLPKFEKLNAVVIGINNSDVQSKKDLVNAEKLTMLLLSDPDTSVSKQYGSTMAFHMRTLSARNTFLIDPTGKIAKVFIDVDSRTHSQVVLDALTELQRK